MAAKQERLNEGMTVFSDPSQEKLYLKIVSAESSDAEFRIQDATGKTVLERRVPVNQLTYVPVSNLAGGIYIALAGTEGKQFSEQFRY